MRRVSVVGNSGSGKTMLAKRIASCLGAPYLELDSVHHQTNWRPLDPDRFRALVDEHTAGDDWVVDGNYTVVQDLVWSRADTVVWLDLPRALVMWQVISRTARRAATREELWNGNREPLRNFLSLVPEESVIAWAWTRHRIYRERYELAMQHPDWSHLRFIRLRSRREASRLIGQRRPRHNEA